MKQLKIGFDLDGVILFWLIFLKKNAKEVLFRLIDQGHLVKIVTARNFLVPLAMATLKLHGLGGIKVVGVGRNGQKYKELDGFDIYIDNKTKHLIAIDGRVKHLYIFGKKSQGNFKNFENWWKIYWEVQWILAEPKKELAV